jgi:hypothetical protein
LGAKSNSKLGRAKSAISRESVIMIAVSKPKVANIGIGAKAITKKPTAVVRAVQKRAKPVVREASRRADFLSGHFGNS